MTGRQTGRKQSKGKKPTGKKQTTRRQRAAEKEAKKANEVDPEAKKQNEKVETIRMLESKLAMSKIDALLAYDKFHKEHPSGEISKEDYMEENKVKEILHVT